MWSEQMSKPLPKLFQDQGKGLEIVVAREARPGNRSRMPPGSPSSPEPKIEVRDGP